MRIKCRYCGDYLLDTDEKCPNCQAPNDYLMRVGNEVPQTIDELKDWYAAHNLPDENITRFFIGKDIKEARAFGIYRDDNTGNYVVYKNKDTGARTVRYEGKDEAYAVNELYMKLKEEIILQKKHNNPIDSSIYHHFLDFITNKNVLRIIVITVAVWFISAIQIFKPIILSSQLDAGYYVANNNVYYLDGTCSKQYFDSCKWYKYNQESISWVSDVPNVKIKELDYIGTTLDNYDSAKYQIKVNKAFDEEEWFEPEYFPISNVGYYVYNEIPYYCYNGNWYVYINGFWNLASSLPHDVVMNPSSYYDVALTYSDPYSFRDYYSSMDDSTYDDSLLDSSPWDSSDSWDSELSDPRFE